jgi:Gas vesicle protein K
MSTTDSPLRIPADAGRGLGQVVVAVLEILRDLLERQAIRRVESGSLTPDEVERLGQALIALDQRFTEIREVLTEERTSP